MPSPPDPAPSAAPADAAARVLEEVLARPSLLGPARLLCLDGPSGAGKSTLAARVRLLARDRGVPSVLLHLDDLYEGWTGLGAVGARLAGDVLGPLAAGGTGRYRRWDWELGAWAEERTVEAADLLVVEGVGSGTPLLDAWRSLLVWVTAPRELRRRRALERDGAGTARHWETWARDEAVVFARDQTAARADVVVGAADRSGVRAR